MKVKEYKERQITVCIITYNQEDYIRDTIEGALMQKDVDLEIVIYNDCSTDKTCEICAEYQSKYPDLIRLVNQNKNRGIILNTRDCLLSAESKYIALCEGDDYWTDPYKLRKQIEVLETRPDISLVHTNWEDYFVDSKERNIYEFDLSRHMCEDDDLNQNTLSFLEGRNCALRFSTVCFRKKDLLEVNKRFIIFSPEYSTVDIAFYIAFSQIGKFFFINEPTTLYRLHSGSVSNTGNTDKQFRFMIGVLRIWDYYIGELRFPRESVKYKLRFFFSQLFPYSFRIKNKELAEELFAISKKYGYLNLSGYICYYGLKFKIMSPICNLMLKMYKIIYKK